MTATLAKLPTRRSGVLPARTWTARALRDVDARGRSELAPVSRVRPVRAGETIYRQGDAADLFFVVTRGEIALERDAGHGAERKVVRAEEGFGAEPFVHPAARRSSTARATVDAEIVELPAQRMQRVVLRSQAPESALADPRMVRTVLADAVARIGRSVLPRAKETHLVDGLTSHRLAHGEPLRATGDAAALVLHGGLLEIGAGRHGTGSLVSLEAHRELVAVDHTWVALFSPAAFASLPREREDGLATRVVDPARVQASRSLLVLDTGACVRCGHCVASCASSHDDGVARLVRHGPALLHGAAFVLPGNCGHCAHPACLLDCPTEAITRDASFAVQIREDACTGCGRCVEACPWGNVRLAVSLEARPVAVKCDLCRGEHAVGGGREPACVASCPVEALVRVEIDRDADVPGGMSGATLDAAVEEAVAAPAHASRLARRAELGAQVAGVALAMVVAAQASSRVSGEVAAALFVLLGLHSLAKRRARGVARSYRAHLAFAAALVPLLVRHLEEVTASAPSALALVSLLALASGGYGALAYALLPRRLRALDDDGTTPDELRREHARAAEQAFLLLTGRDERVKTWWRVRLSPYATSRLGAVTLALSRATAGSEAAKLREEFKRAGQGRLSVETIEPLLAQAVRTRVLAARRLLQAALRGWLPLHVVASVLAMALLLCHVILHLWFH